MTPSKNKGAIAMTDARLLAEVAEASTAAAASFRRLFDLVMASSDSGLRGTVLEFSEAFTRSIDLMVLVGRASGSIPTKES
jgi:hypothetical protein